METPDYRGSQNVVQANSSSNTISKSNTEQQDMNKRYANAIKSAPASMFPKKEQAVILNVVDGLKLSDYVLKIGEIVGPRNISFASRISNNRICIYLSNTELVDHVIKNHPTITIDEREVSIRRLITPAKRIILSNVCPSVPHNVLEKAIGEMGVKPISPISFLRAGILGEEYSHVLSFRRQIYVQPDETLELPNSLVIQHEEINYRIFLSYDGMTCFICKQPGHIASRCPNQSENMNVCDTQEISSITANENNTDEIVIDQNTTQTDDIPSTSIIDALNQVESRINKRPASSTASTPTEEPTTERTLTSKEKENFALPSVEYNTSMQKNKKPRKSVSTEKLIPLEDMMLPVKNVILEASPPFVLNFNQITDFLENVHGNPDPLSVAKQYTKDVLRLLDMLDKLHPHFTHRRIKARCTRIKKKIIQQLNIDQDSYTSEPDTDASQMSTY